MLIYVFIAALAVYLISIIIPFTYKFKSRKALANGDFVNARLYYKKALKCSKYNFKTQMEYVYIIMRTGDFEEALNAMNRLLSYKMEPKNRNLATIQRCMCYYKTGNLEEAYKDRQCVENIE